MTEKNTTLATWAGAIYETLEAMGLDARQVFKDVGLDPKLVKDANARFAVPAMSDLWHRCVEVSGDEAFGLRVPGYCSALTFHGLGVALEASGNMREALDRLVKLSHLISDIADLDYECDERGNCKFSIQLTPADRLQVAHEAIDAFMYSYCQHIPEGGLFRVELVRPTPKTPEIWRETFSAEVHFGCSRDRAIFDEQLLDIPLSASNPALALASEQVALDSLRQLHKSHIAVRVEAEIRRLLDQGEPKQKQIAESLCMSSRQLQRRLAEEGVSFVDILRQVRHQLAKELLAGSNRSVTDISLTLGFSDQSNFASAFKRWQGCSPSEYREQAGKHQ
ncbi:AraC family transcriptional regulator [Pseudomaricurvus alkylphenolicus]|jgi:AraC-like DNA-binding protein|uniref:AraC family transcriptional regulator n=1 Tax=Pseudomaricurvus alkylphenolicus TaxID=1306991 RepID=UPI001422DE3E|nr:AraC family transcriptional regulator [Pseudomaricurvus alkylphenolicus]NIB43848.1 AraC family transcriptional regulator [Pseudomaricurvus alkylphenolicus]